jgi:hypothetical protein
MALADRLSGRVPRDSQDFTLLFGRRFMTRVPGISKVMAPMSAPAGVDFSAALANITGNGFRALPARQGGG